jgi:cytosine/adenosine deaminase-related metal-dependent hydrolase
MDGTRLAGSGQREAPYRPAKRKGKVTLVLEVMASRYLPAHGSAKALRNVTATVTSQEDATESANAGAALVMPAPVNAHDHGYGIRTIDFGNTDDALEVWSAGLGLRPDIDPYLKAVVAFGRLAEGGVGATMHCHNASSSGDLVDEAAAVVRAARHVGIHLAFSCPLIDANPWVYDGPAALKPNIEPADWKTLSEMIPRYGSPEEQMAAVETIASNHDGPGVDIQYGPIGPQWCSEKLLGMIADASRRTGRRVHMHLLETSRQREWLDQRYPQGILHYLDSLGLLSPRLAVAHGVNLRPEDCELLAERGVKVVCNPSANLRLRSGIAPLAAFRNAGLSYAIGLDGTGFDDDQDIWREMRLLYLLNGGRSMHRDTSALEIVDAVTRVGREVVNGREDNDLVLIDYDRLIEDAMFDDLDEAEVLLTRMTKHYVAGLIVGGKWVVKDGKLTNVNIGECNAELRKQARSVAADMSTKRRNIQTLQSAIRQYYSFEAQP